MNGLSCGEESMTICSAVLIQYQRVTDGQTDRQTDVQPISITCFSIADSRKNCDRLDRLERLVDRQTIDSTWQTYDRLGRATRSTTVSINGITVAHFVHLRNKLSVVVSSSEPVVVEWTLSGSNVAKT